MCTVGLGRGGLLSTGSDPWLALWPVWPGQAPIPGATAQPAVLHHLFGNVEQMEMLSSYGSCSKENQGLLGLLVGGIYLENKLELSGLSLALSLLPRLGCS